MAGEFRGGLARIEDAREVGVGDNGRALGSGESKGKGAEVLFAGAVCRSWRGVVRPEVEVCSERAQSVGCGLRVARCEPGEGGQDKRERDASAPRGNCQAGESSASARPRETMVLAAHKKKTLEVSRGAEQRGEAVLRCRCSGCGGQSLAGGGGDRRYGGLWMVLEAERSSGQTVAL